MASEITLTFKLSCNATGGILGTNASYQKTQNLPTAGGAVHHTLQSVPSTANSAAVGLPLSIGSVNTVNPNGYFVLLRNADASAVVNIAKVTANSVSPYATADIGFMRPGEPFGPVRAAAMAATSTNNVGAFVLHHTSSSAVNVEVVICTGGEPAT
jgi:hypothetical protein